MPSQLDIFGRTAQKLSRNPLGIIALFIVLVYAIAALALGISGNALEPAQRWPLIIFLVVFPFVVLGVFVWLVSKHHTKLYAPSDFTSDEGFYRALSAAEAKHRIHTEAARVVSAHQWSKGRSIYRYLRAGVWRIWPRFWPATPGRRPDTGSCRRELQITGLTLSPPNVRPFLCRPPAPLCHCLPEAHAEEGKEPCA